MGASREGPSSPRQLARGLRVATAESLIYRRWVTVTAKSSSAGITAQLDPVGQGDILVIDRMTLGSVPYVPCQCFLYLDDLSSPPIEQSNNGGLDVFEGSLEIPSGSALIFAWTGEVGVSVLTARVHFSLYTVVQVPVAGPLTTWRGPR